MKLTNELNFEKNKCHKLSEKIKELEIIINKKENKKENSFDNLDMINKLNQQLKILNNSLNNNLNKDKIKELTEEIKKKDKIISNYPVQLSEGEKLLSVMFVSLDQKIHYSVICKDTDIFNVIENKLYETYPEYKNIDNNFFVNEIKINRYKNLEFNKIKNKDIIILKNTK